MSAETTPMGIFERYLSLWVALCIAAGVGLGLLIPSAFQMIASFEYASVNLAVAVFIWVMIYPMMVNIDFASLKDIREKPKGLCITLVVNWLIKPFTMAALGILFFSIYFLGWSNLRMPRNILQG
jgi:arsenite transporter